MHEYSIVQALVEVGAHGRGAVVVAGLAGGGSPAGRGDPGRRLAHGGLTGARSEGEMTEGLLGTLARGEERIA